MRVVARSAVYAAAMTRSPSRGAAPSWAVIAVEVLYVTLTAGIYAGLQQRALGIRRRWMGDLAIVALVPGLSQGTDWLLHRAVGAPTPQPALVTACVFTLLSALFHRHVMRQGTFLTGAKGGSLAEDFRRIPLLLLSFAMWPGAFLRLLPERLGREGVKALAEGS